MTKYWVVWNESRTEGAMFYRKSDAESAMDGEHRFDRKLGIHCISTLAESFFEMYGEDDCSIEEIEI